MNAARVLVTGGCGFIGSHLTERLQDEGCEVRVVDLHNPRGTWWWLDELPAERKARLDVRLGDMRDPEFVRWAVADDGGVEVVFHLAALISVPASSVEPVAYAQTNTIGTVHLLGAVRDLGVRRMVHTSTSEVYGTPRTTPITEGHPSDNAQSIYAASKAAADAFCRAHASTFGTPVVMLRPFNTYGPRQSAKAVIPAMLQQLLAGFDEVKLGNLEPRRDFTYVTDTVEGFIRAAEANLAPGTEMQLGTGRAVAIGELFDLCRRLTGRPEAKAALDEQRVRPATSEVQVLLSDPTNARTFLAWQPTVSLEEGLTRTAEWLRPRVNSHDAGRYDR